MSVLPEEKQKRLQALNSQWADLRREIAHRGLSHFKLSRHEIEERMRAITDQVDKLLAEINAGKRD